MIRTEAGTRIENEDGSHVPEIVTEVIGDAVDQNLVTRGPKEMMNPGCQGEENHPFGGICLLLDLSILHLYSIRLCKVNGEILVNCMTVVTEA